MALKKCLKCGVEKSTANYIAVNSFLHNGSLPICRDCLADIIEQSEDKWNTVDKICQWADIPFVPEQWDKIYQGQGRNAFGIYASIFRAAPYDTLDWGMYNEVYLQVQEEDRVTDALPTVREAQKRKLIMKWGQNYDDEQLEYLENLHKGMMDSQNIVGALNEDQALKLCKISLVIEEKIREGSDFSKELKSYDQLSKLANFTPKIIQDANEFSSVGEIFAYLEKKGWVNEYYDDVVRDEVDYSIRDIKLWNQYLYVSDTNIPEDIEARIENLKTSAKISGEKFDEKEFRDYMQEQGGEKLVDDEFELEI